jgi:hypothetical protein
VVDAFDVRGEGEVGDEGAGAVECDDPLPDAAGVSTSRRSAPDR